MSKKKYYAVREGKKIGVFDTWNEAKTYVIGYKGAVYKSFLDYEDAKNFVIGEKSKTKDITSSEENSIIAYVDGSFDIKTFRFSYGVVLIDGDEIIKFNESIQDEDLSKQRNVAGEIYGAIKAIEKAIEFGKNKIYLHHDYMGIRAWALGEWKTNIPLTQNYKKFIDEIKSKIDIQFIKVKAHSNNTYNDMADNLAKEALNLK